MPLVILLHASGGIAGFVTDWETDLNAIGVATFVVDGFSGRGNWQVGFSVEGTLANFLCLGTHTDLNRYFKRNA